MIVWVKSIEVKTIQSGDNAGNPYDLAHCVTEDGEEKNFGLFKPELKKLFANAKEKSQAIDLVTAAKGDFVNAVSGKLLETGSSKDQPEVGESIKESAGSANLPPVTPKPTPEVSKEKTPIAPQEKGMWWKEIGENFRSGVFSKDDDGNGALLWRAYMAQMFIALDLKLKEKGE